MYQENGHWSLTSNETVYKEIGVCRTSVVSSGGAKIGWKHTCMFRPGFPGIKEILKH